jgi:4-hydroxy-3-polyprenylbenzoate decarboxylase
MFLLRIIVGISGARGVILGVNLLKALTAYPECETHLIISDGAKMTFCHETDLAIEDVAAMAHFTHNIKNLAAPISSGSFKTDGMVIIPCSMKTLSGVVTGYTDNLLLRAADVCLKEQRRLVLVPREVPLSRIHVENLQQATRAGCVIVPPMLTFYNSPKTIQDMINHLVGKILMMFNLDYHSFIPWQGVTEEYHAK